MPSLFSPLTVKSNYSLLPIVAITGFACTLCTSYIVYSLKTKPDVSLRFRDKRKMPERDIDPDDIRKLMIIHTPRQHDPAVENLRKEISAHYEK